MSREVIPEFVPSSTSAVQQPPISRLARCSELERELLTTQDSRECVCSALLSSRLGGGLEGWVDTLDDEHVWNGVANFCNGGIERVLRTPHGSIDMDGSAKEWPAHSAPASS
jgi:hypothetical protein